MNTDSTYLLKSWVKAPITRRSLLLMAATTAVAGTSLGKAIGVTAPVITQVLGRPTDSSIAVSVLASQPIATYIEYGYTKTRYTGKSQELQTSPGNPAVFDLKALKANSKVYYRVNYKGLTDTKFTSGKQYSFTTARKAGSTFAFSVHGDTHPERAGKMFNSELYGVTLANIAAQQPDFHIMMGDDFSIDPLIGKGQADQSNVEKIYSTHRNWLTTATSSVPLFLINGNHEQAAAYLLDGTATNPAVLAGNARLKYYPLPAPDAFYTGNTTPVEGVGLPRDYYAWTWGDALFVTLDPYWHSKSAVDNVAGVEDPSATKSGGGNNKKGGATPIATAPAAPTGNGKVTNLWSIGIGDEQYAWLKKTLETSKAKYKFVFAHHVRGQDRGAITNAKLYEWGGYEGDGKTYTFGTNRPGWAKPIHTLFKDTGVSIFFQGHDHVFAHETLDSVTYQAVPMAADSTYQIGMLANASAYVSDTVDGTGHIRVIVSPSCLKVDYVKVFQ